MIDVYAKAKDEAAAKDALRPFGMTAINDDGAEVWATGSHRWALDPVGVLVDNAAVFDLKTGELITPATFYSSWHVNIRLLDETLFDAVLNSGLEILNPQTPSRIWADG